MFRLQPPRRALLQRRAQHLRLSRPLHQSPRLNRPRSLLLQNPQPQNQHLYLHKRHKAIQFPMLQRSASTFRS